MILCFGDSITAGQHLDPPGVAWPALLRGEPVIAAGVPGDTTRLGLLRFPADVAARDADVVVIQFGHNDANRWATDRGLPRVSPRAFEANLHEMAQRCRAFSAVPFLCSITPVDREGALPNDARDYDVIVRRVARDASVPLIDVAAAFEGVPGLLLPDGLHLSAAGHRVYADAVMRVLA